MNATTRIHIAGALLRAADTIDPRELMERARTRLAERDPVRAAKVKTGAQASARAVKAARGDNKLLGKNVRLTWTDGSFRSMYLEELPQKGKKKLRVATITSGPRGDAFMPENIIREQHITKADDFDAMLLKAWRGMENAYRESGIDPKAYMGRAPRVSEVHYLKVEPEDKAPFQAHGKDFVVNLSWTKFSTYSPNSDLSLHDPHYTLVESKSPAAARKLYQALKIVPDALRRMTWDQFTRWLRDNGVAFDYHFSQWT